MPEAAREDPGDRPFEFTDLDRLTDGTIDLVIERKVPADRARGHVPAYHYAVTLHGTTQKVGQIRLRVGQVPALWTAGHIGYEIDPPYRGHRYAARACRLLLPVVRAHRLRPLFITCAPENVASRRTIERIGAKLLGVFDVPTDHEMYRDGRRKICRYEWELAGEAP